MDLLGNFILVGEMLELIGIFQAYLSQVVEDDKVELGITLKRLIF